MNEQQKENWDDNREWNETSAEENECWRELFLEVISLNEKVLEVIEEITDVKWEADFHPLFKPMWHLSYLDKFSIAISSSISLYFFVNTVQKSCSNTKNLKQIYFVLFCGCKSNSFNTSSIAVFLIKTTGINQLYLFNDFRCIVSMIERFWSCTEMVFHGSSWCRWSPWSRIAWASSFCSLLMNGCVK